MERVLLHTCCAPCSLSCIDPLRSEGIEPVVFWYNPNIHPWKEYQARRDCLLAYAPTIGMEVRVQEDYGLKDFVRHVAGDIDHRCAYCYEHRLEGTAKYAAEHGFAAFTSTLLASTYQNHEAIAAAAEMYARQYGVEFLYRDFRSNFRAGNQRARELGFYMQKYCGCVFSEADRYQKQIDRDRANLTRRRRPDRADELPFDAQKRPARQLPRRSFCHLRRRDSEFADIVQRHDEHRRTAGHDLHGYRRHRGHLPVGHGHALVHSLLPVSRILLQDVQGLFQPILLHADHHRGALFLQKAAGGAQHRHHEAALIQVADGVVGITSL